MSTKYFLTFQTVFILNQNIKWMDEYFKYYINLGVEHFYLYDNEGTSGMDFTTHKTNRRQFVTRNNTTEDIEKLDKIIAKYPNYITIVKWQPKGEKGQIIYGQEEAISHYITNFGPYSTWVILMDFDEFLFSPTNINIVRYLKNQPDLVSSLRLQYKPFIERTDVIGDYITQDFRCVNTIIPYSIGSKNILRIDHFINLYHVHSLIVKYKTVYVSPEILRFNHYNLYEDVLRKKWIVESMKLSTSLEIKDIDDGMNRYKYLFEEPLNINNIKGKPKNIRGTNYLSKIKSTKLTFSKDHF